jgi:two-component sensor histidine kinase
MLINSKGEIAGYNPTCVQQLNTDELKGKYNTVITLLESHNSKDVITNIEHFYASALDESNPDDYTTQIETPSGHQVRLVLIKFSLEPEDLSGCFVFLPALVKPAQSAMDVEDIPWLQIVKAMNATLISVNGFADKLAHEYYNELGQEGNSYLQYLYENSNILTSILNEISELATVTNKVPYNRIIDLNLFVNQTIQQVMSLYPGLDIDFQYTDLPKINSSPDVLSVILKNILINCVQFSKTGKIAIQIQAAIKDGWCHITITDNGSGISHNLQHQLLSFYFGSTHHKEESKPEYGNGMATAVFLTRRLGGALALSSTEGKGTSVEITLPAIERKRELS